MFYGVKNIFMMWKPINCKKSENSCYMVKLQQLEEGIQIYLTDLRNLWSEEITENSLLIRFKQMNPTLELKNEAVLTQIQDLFENNSNNTEFEVTNSEGTLKVQLKQKLGDFSIKFFFNLEVEDSLKFMEELTIPFIHTIKFLEDQGKKLCDLLEKKDRELEEYRLEKGLITRGDLMTGKFDRNVTQCQSNKLVLQVFEEPNFWNNFTNKFGNCDIETIEVVKDNWNNLKRKRTVYSSKTRNKQLKSMYKSV